MIMYQSIDLNKRLIMDRQVDVIDLPANSPDADVSLINKTCEAG